MTKFLSEYKPYEYDLKQTHLKFVLEDDNTVVQSKLTLSRSKASSRDIELDGERLELVSVAIDGRLLGSNEYQVTDSTLKVFNVPDEFELEIENKIKPGQNQTKVGLYKSDSVFCTQCEPEAFRSITYYPDRPDVLATFRVTINADAATCPIVLSNGNKISETKLANGRKEVSFEDPFPKPSYLFALIAGQFNKLEDEFTTASGRHVRLAIYLQERDPQSCTWAMESLKRAMAWDERVYGREYDLDQFNIVGVDHFVFGAMENKGLNIFNSSVLLASPELATDMSYRRIEGIIAHEYFHNWSGDRVTCRDWFQLSLKEGFTVMRDAHFSADMNGHAVKYIEEAQTLRERQFPEDRGPQVHAVRPSQYAEINNNYTRTVYDKGAQVVRMLSILLGPELWRKATDLYFSRHDGQAVTVEDFLLAAEDVSGRDLTQFKLWYTQSGNPIVRLNEQRSGTTCDLQISQSIYPTQDQPKKVPMHIPLALGIVDKQVNLLDDRSRRGEPAPAFETNLNHSSSNREGSVVFDLVEKTSQIRFEGVPETAEFSVFRGFSAPVTIRYESQQPLRRLKELALHDTDGFSRNEAVQTTMIEALAHDDAAYLNCVHEIVGELLDRAIETDNHEKQELLVRNLLMPNELVVLDDSPGIDLSALIDRRESLLESIADRYEDTLLRLLGKYQAIEDAPYRPDNESIAQRGLVQVALQYLIHSSNPPEPMAPRRLRERLDQANNLTTRLTYLSTLIEQEESSVEERLGLLDDFYATSKNESLLVDHWYQLQARSRSLGNAQHIQMLANREADESMSPNRVNAIWGVWSQNVKHFHKADGSGYELLAATIQKWDTLSPQVAARLLDPFVNWHRFDDSRQCLIKDRLAHLQGATESPDLQDLIQRSLEFEPPQPLPTEST